MRRKLSREFKIQAVKLVTERGFAVAPACRDLNLAESVLRRRDARGGCDVDFHPEVTLVAA